MSDVEPVDVLVLGYPSHEFFTADSASFGYVMAVDAAKGDEAWFDCR